MIRYASQSPHKIRSTTSVNLNAVTDDQIKGLLTLNLDALHISIDGVTQEVYEKYRVGGNLETVFNNLKKLIYKKIKQIQNKNCMGFYCNETERASSRGSQENC